LGLIWDTGGMAHEVDVADVNPRPLPLVMAPARGRGKPPRHLADLSADERKAAAEELGLKPFRVKQVAHHYFARLERDPERR